MFIFELKDIHMAIFSSFWFLFSAPEEIKDFYVAIVQLQLAFSSKARLGASAKALFFCIAQKRSEARAKRARDERESLRLMGDVGAQAKPSTTGAEEK